MPTEQQYRAALLKAHRDGDTRAAELFATKIKALRQAPQDAVVEAGREVAAETPFIEVQGGPLEAVRSLNPFYAARRQLESVVRGDEPFISGRAPTAVGQGIMDIATGVQQRFAEATGDEERAAELTEEVEQQRARFQGIEEQDPMASTLLRAAGSAAATPIPGLGAKTFLGRLAGTVGGATLAGSLEATGKDESWLQNALVAGGLSMGLQGLTEGGAKLLSKYLNKRAGQFASDDVAQFLKEADEQGLIVTPADVSDSAGIQRVQKFAEDIPGIGSAKTRVTQVQQQEDIARNLVNEFGDDSDDIAETLQVSLKNKYGKFKNKATELFDDASKKLNPLGEVNLEKTTQQIDEIIAEQQSLGSLGKADLIEELSAYRAAPRDSFDTVRTVRQRLGKEIRDLERGLSPDSERLGALKRVKGALENDLDSFAETAGSEGMKAYRKANSFYRQNVVPFKTTRLKKLLDTGEPEQIVNFLTAQPGKGGIKSRANTVYKSLDGKGRDAVRSHLLAKAFEEAQGKTPGDLFSAGKFASELEKVQNITGVFFNEADKRKIDAIQKLMRGTQAAGSVAATPPTGVRLVLPATIGIGTGIIPPVLISRLIASPKSTKFLMAASKATPGSAAFRDAANALNRILAAEAQKWQGEQE